MNFQEIYDPILKIAIAAVVGGIIGAEREYRNKAAGLKTIVLICIGSTLFTILSYQIGDEPDRIAANIITGIGFLGAGVIFKDEGRVSGITTASTVWVTAALGMCIAVGNYALTAILVLAVLIVLLAFERFEIYLDKVHKVYTYTIVTKTDEAITSEILGLLNSSKLKTTSVKLFKKGPNTIFIVLASGHPDQHENFTGKLFTAEHVSEFYY